jgi:hypothetical protein
MEIDNAWQYRPPHTRAPRYTETPDSGTNNPNLKQKNIQQDLITG